MTTRSASAAASGWLGMALAAANINTLPTRCQRSLLICGHQSIGLAHVANRWSKILGIDESYPVAHTEFLLRCHQTGQTKPTPLLLKYGAGDYNCLHQDLYGEHVFPLQVTFLLSVPDENFTGGEFVLTEQRPRMQSRVEVIGLQQGDGVIFAVRHRPVRGTRGPYRVNLRHGVSRLRSGSRYTLGIIFHDGK